MTISLTSTTTTFERGASIGSGCIEGRPEEDELRLPGRGLPDWFGRCEPLPPPPDDGPR
jgi:hypothetical protein